MILRKTRTVVRKGVELTRAGFTLMEVLVVVAIIVILAGVGTVYLLPRLGESKVKVAKANLKTLANAAETFELNNDRKPNSLDELSATQPNGDKPLVPSSALKDPWGKKYILDPNGPKNQGASPDVWTTTPDGKTIGNWPGSQ
jgi:general secretion pathway protein G